MAARLRDELEPLGEVTSKPMFGGHGIFCDGVMFGLVDSGGTPFLRIHEGDPDAETPAGTERHGRMPYWSVSDDVLARQDVLLERARRSLDMARATSRR
ncbi:MAG: TfoX/Sxy family protein [Chloroflexi bacterium]|nr:TfoX/Sxy family protein [Chloroflexota bacterium]